jgi:hypothetical protein
VAVTATAAVWITSATTSGREIMITCEPSTSVMVAPSARPSTGLRPCRPPCRGTRAPSRTAGISRRAPGRLGEGQLSDRPLGRGHHGGLLRRQVGGEYVVCRRTEWGWVVRGY